MANRKIGQLPIKERQPIWGEVKVYYEIDMPYSKIIDNIEHKHQVTISRGQITKKAEEGNWEKTKNKQLKSDIIEYEKENETILQKKETLVSKVANLTDFEITTLNDVIQDETKISSLITSTATLAIIRTNQMLTNNNKEILTKETFYSDEGKPISSKMTPQRVELEPKDLKDISETVDKLSITTKVNPRHAQSQVQVNNQNQQQNNTPTQIIIERDT